jgi:Family of unknown function (DUF6527)
VTLATLRQVSDQNGRRGAHVLVWCPGCDAHDGFGLHRFGVVGDDGSEPDIKWTWNGSLDVPHFDPSYLCWTGDRDNPYTRCHSYLHEGRWQFLADSTHPLAGQTVDMVPLPAWVLGEE